ncbi:phosphoenolpyruvate synthase [Pseudokordiimonas caeni]|uniref:phosphoenolpyruvate synthase n=1 Tax=Pseudokordiimonas caeni TaxID=2997908 RepID=UPI002811D8DE|nr:phosphoenolpyruvate synthase [Pseudokordiimonas caeni]
MERGSLVIRLADVRRTDIARVGGKNASLGEMIAVLKPLGIRVPDGFATTAEAFGAFLDAGDLRSRLRDIMGKLNGDLSNVAAVGDAARNLLAGADLPSALSAAIIMAYRTLSTNGLPATVAVRSSATAEDLPEASFAGQLQSFLNVIGEKAVLAAVKRCFASLYTDRAIVYRATHGYDQLAVAVSVGIQHMVRADLACSGVMFSIDTETGFPKTILISGAFGLGETVVQGLVDADEYMTFKPFLEKPGLAPIIEKRCGEKKQRMVFERDGGGTRLKDVPEDERRTFALHDDEILTLSRWAVAVENHYGQPMDMEWAKDGLTGELYMVQARPETVQARRNASMLRTYRIKTKQVPLVSGQSVGESVATGPVCRLDSPSGATVFPDGAVLVAPTTDPDWLPILKRASAVVTDQGGRTSHAAIVARELGLTAVVGTGNATTKLRDGDIVTVSCAGGADGHVYAGKIPFEVTEIDLRDIPETRTRVMVNLANPAAAFRWWQLPCDGIGLARMEFIISNHIRIHPMALAHFERVTDAAARAEIEHLTAGYDSREDYFVERLARGIARLAATYHPRPVIVRTSDFKTNEYAALIGGAPFEPNEPNPMIGWRGASRYYSEGYRDGFALECKALRMAREILGFSNIVVMIPFCRTLDEADKVIAEMARHGLVRRRNGLQLYMMCEIPSNVILAEEFGRRFDGFSIGSNDLTQLTLGIDRDSALLAPLFSEHDPAVTRSITTVIGRAHKVGIEVGLCGQAPSDHPDFAQFLVESGIDSMSVNPDSFLSVKTEVAAVEKNPEKFESYGA